jgi:hypothetical protein
MTKLLVVSLGLVLSLPAPEAFSLAQHVGEPSARDTFFRFSTSAGKYTIRHDGLGEVAANLRRRVFSLKLGGKGRIERIYFLEHQGDLFLRYDVVGQGAYLMRLEQKKRKPVWFTALGEIDATDQPPSIDGDVLTVADTIVVSKIDGRILGQD